MSLIEYLVELGADINWESAFGTPLLRACNYGNKPVVNYLVEHGVDINAVDPFFL